MYGGQLAPNTRSPPKVFVSKTNSSSFMPPHRTTKNSTLRQRGLLERTGPGRIVMRPCDNCSRLGKECRVGNESDKCIECVRLHRKCDLAFSAVEWKKIKNERDRIYKDLLDSHRRINEAHAQAGVVLREAREAREAAREAAAKAEATAEAKADALVQEAVARANRLQTQFQFLEDKEQGMVEREFRNIAELEEDERRSSEPTLDDLLFDVSSEQFEVPPNFGWLDSSVGTVAEASGSS